LSAKSRLGEIGCSCTFPAARPLSRTRSWAEDGTSTGTASAEGSHASTCVSLSRTATTLPSASKFPLLRCTPRSGLPAIGASRAQKSVCSAKNLTPNPPIRGHDARVTFWCPSCQPIPNRLRVDSSKKSGSSDQFPLLPPPNILCRILR